MPKVIGVRFRTSPRVYYFAPKEGEEYPKDSKVMVETQRGVEMVTVVMPETEVDDGKIVSPLKPVIGRATEQQVAAARADDEKKQEIIAVAKQKVAARELDMKIVDCEFTVDHSKLVLYFTAEQRVDFRELVRDLASAFHIRIDLRQIGARDECKLIGSLGSCGMPCCCGRFESENSHVSIKMAKNQNLALTPKKINGMCGRLLCCLAYENKTYEDVIKRAPKHNAVVTCPDGRRGTVVSVTPLTEKVRVRVGDDDNFEFCEYTLAELNGEKPVEPRESVRRSEADALSDYDYMPEPPPERRGGNRQNRNRDNGNNNNNNNGGREGGRNRNKHRNRDNGNGRDGNNSGANNNNNNRKQKQDNSEQNRQSGEQRQGGNRQKRNRNRNKHKKDGNNPPAQSDNKGE